MNQRIMKLREQSLSASPCISVERARLVTRFYRGGIAHFNESPIPREATSHQFDQFQPHSASQTAPQTHLLASILQSRHALCG